MFTTSLDLIASSLTLVFVLALLWTILFQKMAVAGSRQKYVLTTWVVILCGSIVALNLYQTMFDLLNKNYVNAGIDTIGTLLYGYLAWKYLHEDNWFNSQYKKLKRGLKNLGERLSYMLSPSPAPVPI